MKNAQISLVFFILILAYSLKIFSQIGLFIKE